ncbi:LEA type 2 family protein [Haloarcula sp. S1CR25-12]|uniref:LEA type 2 family protein n=1 Tax=Haloarcula saliterrae TaxID=2950534 RepID=A0ABU2F9V2_9EURY|nr:LEA type 2 family protein [Haloarcula sp. S1CR25-12]MDS0259001.1 LEA type 2 family protein [Haloarcula sp. S1CR25-12]
MVALGRSGKVGVVALVLVGSIGGAFAVGLVGTPGVETVENRFTDISANTTTIGTTLTVSNPNPVGVTLGGTAIEYTISMNDVAVASGEKTGIALTRGNSTLDFSTRMRNSEIPPWWTTHIANGERTTVHIDATVSDSLVGEQSFSFTQNRTIQTDILGAFNTTETRPVDANVPFVSDPVLYVNETRGSWDRENLTRSETPLDTEFDVYNPKPVPYTVTRVGYTTYMNDVRVGSGETKRGYFIGPGERETVGVDTRIRTDSLDRWWVSHLQRNQNTELYIDFYLVLEAGGERFRVDLDAIDYEKPIETDIFGTKASSPTGNATAGGAPSDGSPDEDGGDAAEGTPTPSEGTESGDGGLLGGGL